MFLPKNFLSQNIRSFWPNNILPYCDKYYGFECHYFHAGSEEEGTEVIRVNYFITYILS
jgi:hypothetical protein